MPPVFRSKPVQFFPLRALFGSVEWRPTRFLRMGLVLVDGVVLVVLDVDGGVLVFALCLVGGVFGCGRVCIVWHWAYRDRASIVLIVGA